MDIAVNWLILKEFFAPKPGGQNVDDARRLGDKLDQMGRLGVLNTVVHNAVGKRVLPASFQGEKTSREKPGGSTYPHIHRHLRHWSRENCG